MSGWLRDLAREGVEANPGPCCGASKGSECEGECLEFDPSDADPHVCTCGHQKNRHVTVPPPRDAVPSASKALRADSMCQRVLTRNLQDLKLHCDICGIRAPSDAQVRKYPKTGFINSHIVAIANKPRLKNELLKKGKRQQLGIDRIWDTANGLYLCRPCDRNFEQHKIEIHPDGSLSFTKKAAANEYYKAKLAQGKLKKVPWSHFIGQRFYPTAALLKFRSGLPIVTPVPPHLQDAVEQYQDSLWDAANASARLSASSKETTPEKRKPKRKRAAAAAAAAESSDEEAPKPAHKKAAAGSTAAAPAASADWSCPLSACGHRNKAGDGWCKGPAAAAAGTRYCGVARPEHTRH